MLLTRPSQQQPLPPLAPRAAKSVAVLRPLAGKMRLIGRGDLGRAIAKLPRR
jgi:hypothetical protein